MYEPVGLLVVVFGIILIISGMMEISLKKLLFGFLIGVFGLILREYPKWGMEYLFLKNATMAVPTWVLVLVGVTVYFTLNHIYTTGGIYAVKHPDSLAAKILGPWPMYLMMAQEDRDTNPLEKGVPYCFGTLLFCVSWCIAIISYAAWLIFGGGIAKLLHLVPRE